MYSINKRTILKFEQGLALGLVLAMALYVSAPAQIIEVPVTHVVEKQVIVKVPTYVNSYDKQQIDCLAENVYFEAGNQPTKGKIAVTNVVMNRANSGKYPRSACGVVKQKSSRGCQFSWVCENPVIRDLGLLRESKKVAEQVYLKNVGDVTGGALFYHASYVSPSWSYTFARTVKIGDHIFYKG